MPVFGIIERMELLVDRALRRSRLKCQLECPACPVPCPCSASREPESLTPAPTPGIPLKSPAIENPPSQDKPVPQTFAEMIYARVKVLPEKEAPQDDED